MLWESGSGGKENPDEQGWGSNSGVTPVLVPAQSGSRTTVQNVPVLVPDVQELKEQFQQQQNMLTQLKESIKENESQLNSKGKKIEAYVNRLSQIRARTKNSDKKTSNISRKAGTSPALPLSKKTSKENLAKESDTPQVDKTGESNLKLSPKCKISELKKRVQESKLKFEERTGKEVSETKKIESIVENLKMQLEERDVTIQELKKIVEKPVMPNVKDDNSLKRNKARQEGRVISSKSTQTIRLEQNESIEVIALQNRIYELEAKILDLQESLKEKESVIDARTQAVTLLSQDLSIKGKNTLECLEETRQEMRAMQNNFIIVENQLKKELVEKDDRLMITEDNLKKLESINLELRSTNVELQEKLANMEKKYVDLESDKMFLNESIVKIQNDDAVAELNKKISILSKELDDSNKSMIKMKLEHKNKIKSLDKTIGKLKETSDDKAEILRLQTLVDEFEVIRESFQNKIAELEEEKVTEKKLKDTVDLLEAQIQNQASDIERHLQTISNIEKEKLDIIQSTQDQNIVIENLYLKIQNLEYESLNKDLRLKELEDEYKIKMEMVKSEHIKEVENLESYYNLKMASNGRKELEEYRVTNELNKVQVEEQIDILVKEKMMLLEKLKSLSGISSTEFLTFETVEHSEFQSPTEPQSFYNVEEYDGRDEMSQIHLNKSPDDQQDLINNLQNAVKVEKEKVMEYQRKIQQLEKSLEQFSNLNERDSLKMLKGNMKNKIKKIQTDLVESKKTIQLQNEKLEELNMKLEEKEQLIKNYIEKIECFEKDDWGRENDWKATQDEFEHVQELQKKCLSLENSLIELNEHCERLRKENIEVVHLLSEEKVNRKKLMERLNLEEYGNFSNFDERFEVSMNKEWPINELEERILRLIGWAEKLEEKLKILENRHGHPSENLELELQENLEWSNIVLAGKDTEIFRLQSLLEDNSKTIEDLEMILKDTKMELAGKCEELGKKETEMRELSANFVNLRENLNLQNQSQLNHLVQNIKTMEVDFIKKDNEIKEAQNILAEKNMEITKLKQNFDQVSRDLTSSYKEHLENMEKCLSDKEQKYQSLLLEKNELEESKRKLISINEDICNQKVELLSKNGSLQKLLQEKENMIEELNSRLNEAMGKERKEENEELKLKLKKLAANLKKKVQNEKDLLQQLKEQEEFIAEKEKILQKLNDDFGEVNEKWMTEKSEKERFKIELDTVLSARSALNAENADLKEKLKFVENEYNSTMQKEEYKLHQMETQLQKMYENSERMKLKQEQDRVLISSLESSASENEKLKKAVAETCGKYEENKIRYEELNLEKSRMETELNEMKAYIEQLKTDNTCQQMKIQEQMGVIESLENDLSQAINNLRRNEEKLGFLEERRSSLENKTEEMLKRIEEDSKIVIAVDDMSAKINELTESEHKLKSTLKSLDDKNKEMESENKELNASKTRLEKELNDAKQKLIAAYSDLEKLRDLDADKSASLEYLTTEYEKLKSVKMESKQKSADIAKLKKDIELLEADLKENVQNSESIEKSLNYKIEELLQENAILVERNKELEEKEHQEENKQKSKKSLTFKTDEMDYIRDLKAKIHEYYETIKKSGEEIASLKMKLLRERLKNEVTEVLSEAKEKVESLKSTPEKEKKFDTETFFGTDAAAAAAAAENNIVFDNTKDEGSPEQVDFDSLMWDDGWGTDGHLEEQYLSSQSFPANQEKCDILEKELKMMTTEKQKVEEELQQVQAKCAKAIKKMKEQKSAYDKLQNEVKRLKNDAEFGGLDGAIIDEFKSQIASLEQREKELIKNLDSSKTEKETLLKRLETLNAGNEKFVEMKEIQNNEMERWEDKNRELLREIAELREELSKEKTLIDSDNLVKDLMNKVEGLEWENCELKESLEEKQEQLDLRNEGKQELLTEMEELKRGKESLEKRLIEEEKKNGEVINELQEQVTALASENETLQEILGGMKKSEKKPEPAAPPLSETKIFDYFKSTPASDVFSSVIAQPVEEPVVERKFAVQAFASNHIEKELEQLKQENRLLQEQLSEAQSIITTIKTERHEMGEKYRAEYESALSFHLEEKNNALQKVYELEQALAIKIEELNNISTRVKDLDQVVALKTEELNEISRGRQELEQAFGMKSEESNNMLMKIKELEQVYLSKTLELEKAKAKEKEFEVALLAKGDELNNLIRTVHDLEEKLQVREDEGFKILTELAAKAEEVKRLSLKTQELEEECNRKSVSLENAQKMNNDLLQNSADRTVVEELQKMLSGKDEEINLLNNEITNAEEKVKKLTQEYERQRILTEEYCDAKEKLEDLVSNLQTELETANIELELSRKELEELRRIKEEDIAELEARIDLMTSEAQKFEAEKEEMQVNLNSALTEKESSYAETLTRLQHASKGMEAHIETLKTELKEKENDIFELSKTLDEEQKQLDEVRALLEVKDSEIAELKQALSTFQEEISSFRNFEKQVKELRIAQMGSNAPVTAEGDPDFTNWTEHELVELNTRLQSDLDTALYMLHQRDIRCDELTFELMQLLEERDTLQLRLSTAIRISEELKSLNSNDKVTYVHDKRQDNKDLVDQSNDRQTEKIARLPEENLQQLAQKISELHSVGYLKDKTIQEETLRRHRDQMTLLGHVSDPDFDRDGQSSPVLSNWIRTGKTTPKVMHI